MFMKAGSSSATRAATGQRRAGIVLIGLLLFSAAKCPGLWAADKPDYEVAKARFAQLASIELQRQVLPGVSVAWIVDGQVVHAAGYGQADWERGVPATADTVYRAGSISKLLNAVAAMQLVERGKFDLDAPIERALPTFRIVNPFEPALPITIRQLLCHRSGMVREAPLGGYFDPSQPTIEATVASIADCALVNPPNSKTRYSNVGPTIVGRALEVQTGEAFAHYQQRHVLGPLGMASSCWTMNDELRPRLAKGRMRVARGDGSYELQTAPEFELGTQPAGNLYTTASDLARFAAFVMQGASSSGSAALLKPESLQAMFVPQLTSEPTGFGLGFAVNKFRAHKTVQHMGAVYGFTTSIIVLPETRLGVVVLANSDIAIAPVRRLAEAGLDILLETVKGEFTPEGPRRYDPAPGVLAEMAGDYESQSHWAHVVVDGARLQVDYSGQEVTLLATADLKFQAEGRILYRAPVEFQRDAGGKIAGFSVAGQVFRRVGEQPPPAPAAWQKLVGSYGPKFIPLVVSIRHGHLYATVENEYDYRLTPLNRVTFNLSPGMYADEQVVFQIDPSGQVLGALMAGMMLPRSAP